MPERHGLGEVNNKKVAWKYGDVNGVPRVRTRPPSNPLTKENENDLIPEPPIGM